MPPTVMKPPELVDPVSVIVFVFVFVFMFVVLIRAGEGTAAAV